MFATGIAKYFANALREDTLLHRCRGGIVYLPGQAGTVQEIFQAVTENFYAADADLVAPMVLVGMDYWTERPAGLAAAAAARGGPADGATTSHCVDDVAAAAALLLRRGRLPGPGADGSSPARSEGSSGVARVSTASSTLSCSSSSRSTWRSRTATAVLDVVAGHVDRGDQVQPGRADELQVQVGDPVDLGPVEQVAPGPVADLGPDRLADQEPPVAVDQERPRPRPSSRPTRIEPIASGTGDPVSWCSPMPAKAIRMPMSAAASSANTARRVGLEVVEHEAEHVPAQRFGLPAGLAERLGERDALQHEGDAQHDVGDDVVGRLLRVAAAR